jgi:hypothetical protein
MGKGDYNANKNFDVLSSSDNMQMRRFNNGSVNDGTVYMRHDSKEGGFGDNSMFERQSLEPSKDLGYIDEEDEVIMKGTKDEFEN